MKRIIAFLGVMCLILAGCANTKPIKIGFSGGLTGRASEVAVEARNAVILAVEEINNQGGINGSPLELVISDDQNNYETAVQVDKKLIHEDKVSAIIGHITSNLAEAALHVADTENIIILSPSMSSHILENRDDNFFRTLSSSIDEQGEKISKFAYDKGIRKIAVFHSALNKDFSFAVAEVIKEQFINRSGQVLIDEIIKDDTNFIALAQSIKETNPQGVFMALNAIEAAALAQQLKKIDYQGAFYGIGWTSTNDLVSNGGKAVEGMITVNVSTPKERSEAYKTFSSNYKEKFGKEPSFIAPMAYDSARVLIETLKKCPNPDDPMSIKKTLLEIKEFKALERTIIFNEYGDASFPFSFYIVKDGSIVPLEE